METSQDSGAAGWAAERERTVTVEGNDFLVRPRADEPGVYDCDWTTGPHPYGFTFASSPGAPLSVDDLEDELRRFLAQIDPRTGYIR